MQCIRVLMALSLAMGLPGCRAAGMGWRVQRIPLARRERRAQPTRASTASLLK